MRKNFICGERVKLIWSPIKGGTIKSLCLEHYIGIDPRTGYAIRRREKLNIYLYAVPKNAEQRQHNKEQLAMAKKVQQLRETELVAHQLGAPLPRHNVNYWDWMDGYYNAYTKKDKRMIEAAIRRFRGFIGEAYPQYMSHLPAQAITKAMVAAFVDFLNAHGRRTDPKSVYARWKKMLRAAIDEKIIREDPTKGVRMVVDEEALLKDILSEEEIEKLLATKVIGQNPEVRRAFTFCLFTGIRWCDVKELTYKNIDYSNKLLRFEQRKTTGHSSSSWVNIPLNDELLEFIGLPPANHFELHIFSLPSYEMADKSLKRWVNHAGINKRISWHCARHSFAVNLLNNGANIKTVASLLGHASLQHTEKYTRAVDSLKKNAIDSLPTGLLNKKIWFIRQMHS